MRVELDRAAATVGGWAARLEASAASVTASMDWEGRRISYRNPFDSIKSLLHDRICFSGGGKDRHGVLRIPDPMVTGDDRGLT